MASCQLWVSENKKTVVAGFYSSRCLFVGFFVVYRVTDSQRLEFRVALFGLQTERFRMQL